MSLIFRGFKRFSLKKASHAFACGKENRVAVLLHGCGVYDGTEIQEACSVLFALSRNSAHTECFSVSVPQMHVVDHTKGAEDEKDSRDCIVESSRITRGQCKNLDDLDVNEYDALIVPGGFGAAKNLSDFASKGAELTLNNSVEMTFKKFQDARKPIGLCCISPILAAKYANLQGKSFKLTMGKSSGEEWPFKDAVGAGTALGNEMVEMDLDDVCIDQENLIVTSAAYMKNGKPHEILDNVTKMVEATLSLACNKH